MAKRIKRKVGNVVKIPLSDGNHGYGFELPHGLVAVVNYHGQEELSAQDIVQVKPLFTVMVVDRAIKSLRWPVIGYVELSEVWLRPVKFYKQDALHGELLFLKWSDGTEVPTDMDGIEGLEKAAIWGPEHVEDRIMDHFAGRPNRWLKSIALRK